MSAPPETAALDLPADWSTEGPRYSMSRPLPSATRKILEESIDDDGASLIRSGVTSTESREIFALVYRQMRSLAARRPDFDDLVQIAAEQILRSLPSFEGRSKLSTWTYRVCYLTVLRHERWYRRWLRRFALTEGGELPETACQGVDDRSFEERERAVRLRRAVANLSPKRRAVVVLHDLEGQPIAAVAQIVKANPLTVRSRLRDGRRDLARILASDPYFGDEACGTESEEVSQ